MLDVSPVEVAATDELPYPNMAAFYNNEKQTLYVKRNVGDSVAVAQCVAQELGHAQLSINSESYSRRDMGFQAVCIGYMLCKKYGVDTQNLRLTAFRRDWLPKSRKKSVRSFPRPEMQWQKFTVISLMKCSARNRSVQRTMRDNGGQIWKRKLYHVALDDYEHGVVIRSLNDEKTKLMEEGKSADAVDDLLVKVGNAPLKSSK